MQLKYELTKDDYIEFNMYHLEHSESARRTINMQKYFFALLFPIIAMIIARFTSAPTKPLYVIFFIGAVFCIINYPKYYINGARKNVSNLLDSMENNQLIGPRTLVVKENGIWVKSKTDESNVDLDGIEKISETPSSILIYLNDVMAYIVPKRVFQDENHKNEFLNLIKN